MKHAAGKVAVRGDHASKGRVRYSVDLPCQIDARLEELAEERGMKKSELLRKALRILVELDGLEKNGFDTGAWKIDGEGNRETVKMVVA